MYSLYPTEAGTPCSHDLETLFQVNDVPQCSAVGYMRIQFMTDIIYILKYMYI